MEQCRALPEKTDHNYQFCLPLGIDWLKSVKPGNCVTVLAISI